MQRLTGEAWKHTEDTLISNLAYVTHHKHAHSLATNREVERMGGGISVAQNDAPKPRESKQVKEATTKGRNRKDGTQESKGKLVQESKHLPSVYRTETRQREENTRRLHSSHIKGAFSMEYWYVGSFIHHDGSASGELKEFRLGGRLNIDHGLGSWGGGGGP